MNRYIFFSALFLITAFAQAAEALTGVIDNAESKIGKNKWSWENIKISDRLAVAKQISGEKIYALAKNDGKWSIINYSDFSENNPNHELISIYMEQDAALLRVLFTKACPENLLGLKNSSVDCYCTTGVLSTTRKSSGYNVCSSNFGGIKTTAGGAVSSLIGLYGGLIAASPSYLKEIDIEKIKDVAVEVNFLSLINSEYYAAYKKNFDEITTISLARDFKEKYKNYDPDLFLPSLEGRMSMIAEAETKVNYAAEERLGFSKISTSEQAMVFVEKYKKDDPENLVSRAKELINKYKKQEDNIQKELAQKRREKELEEEKKINRLNAWRNKLKAGDETFCGMVIEAKYPMFKIAINTPLQGYASEVWLRVDQIYEPSSGCRNTNGRLSPV